jgi:hypothetical protein
LEHSYMHLFIQQIFIACLFNARHSASDVEQRHTWSSPEAFSWVWGRLL